MYTSSTEYKHEKFRGWNICLYCISVRKN